MGFYAIGVGGTGAKCIEALVYLCAAGVIEVNELYLLFVDADKSNGTLERVNRSIKLYQECKNLNLGTTDLFKTNIVVANPSIWSPLGERENTNLEDFFGYDTLRQNNQNNHFADLFDVLYSADEKAASLKRGFRGHPSIGAAVMARTLDFANTEPWVTFSNRISSDINEGQEAKIILSGSVFGGTGASGLPTIPKLIKEIIDTKANEKEVKAKIAAILMTPYFSFTPVKDLDIEDDKSKIKADSNSFLIRTQCALNYYYESHYLKDCNPVYILGEHSLSSVNISKLGGPEQRNEPHFIEIFAALAMNNFFSEPTKNYQVIARKEEKKIYWEDFPHKNRQANSVKEKLAVLTRFSFAYLSTYYPLLENLEEKKTFYQAPWYVDYFQRNKVNLSQVLKTDLLAIKNFCKGFLLWLANIQTSAKELDLELINWNKFALEQQKEEGGKKYKEVTLRNEFELSAFLNLLLPVSQQSERGLSNLWQNLCMSSVRDEKASGVGKFIRALFEQCKLL